MAKQKHIPVIKFNRRKYGGELLVDIVTLETIRNSPNFAKALRQSFYGLMLTTGGEGDVEVDGVPMVARKGLMACARPGDVGIVINDCGLQALELIFERDFLLSFFSDPHFLDGISYLSPQRTSPYLMLDEALYNRIIGLYDSLLLELHGTGNTLTSARTPGQHLLRAMLYEVLMLLQKATPVEVAPAISVSPDTGSDRVSRFRQLVNEHYLTESGVEFYADRLCVTSNYLNRLVRQNLGQSTKQYIQSRRIEEAKRLLRYTDLPVNDIADRLGFDTASYFVRAFSRQIGLAPLQFRGCPEK